MASGAMRTRVWAAFVAPRGTLPMIFSTRARRLAGLYAAPLTAAVALAACSSAPPPAAVAPPPPAPVAVVPNVSLSPRVVEMASAYRAYVDRAGANSPGFTGGGDVAQGLKVGEA